MKKTAIYLLFVLFAIPLVTEAKVWRVNNNPAVTADFNSLIDAMNAYGSGDTIHLEPSATPYTVLNNTFTNHSNNVTIIGNGYFHFPNDSFQQDILQSIISVQVPGTDIFLNGHFKFIGVTFNNNVVLSQLSGQIFIYGMSFESCLINGDISYFNNGGYSDEIDQVHFSKNYISGGFNITIASSYAYSYLNDFSFENNIINNLFKIDIGAALHNQIVIRNNVFLGGYTCANGYLANNIFYNASTPDPSALTGSILKNNIFAASVFTTGATLEVNNQFGVDMNTVFSNNPCVFRQGL
ncbi:MAG: hypothetical protein ABI741_09240 [Ferruginibacter sp.]